MPQRHHLPVYLRAHALVSHFRMHHVRKIHRRGPARQLQHASFRRERIYFQRREIHFQGGQKLAGFLHLLGPLDELAHPGNALIVVLRAGLAGLVFPVRRHAFFGDAMHFLRADLHFERLAAVQNRGVQRLIQVGPRNGDIILKPARHRPPNMMHYSQRGIAAALRVCNDANGQQIVNLFETRFLPQHLAMQRIQRLHARFQLRRNAGLHQLRTNGRLHFIQKFLVERRFVADLFLQRKERLRLEIPERQILEFPAHHAHSQAVRNGRVNVQRFAGNALLLVGVQVLQRAHVVQAVRELYQYDAYVGHHRQQHLAYVFGLARFRSRNIQPPDFCYALNQVRHFRPKALFNPRNGILRVFNGVV